MVGCMRIGITAGNLLGSLTYSSIKDWRYETLYFQVIFSGVIFVIVLIFLYDTPQSMIKTKSAI